MNGNIYEHYEAGLNPPEDTGDSLWFVFNWYPELYDKTGSSGNWNYLP